MAKPIVTYAFLVVLLTTAVIAPFLLYGMGMVHSGWQWPHAALLVAMVASTDALAVSAIIKTAGGPESLVVLMEGESLLVRGVWGQGRENAWRLHTVVGW